MTREEKIDLLEKEKAYMLSHGGDRQAIALDAAIKALEQETVSKESYDHEYFLRKDFEIKIDKLQRQLEEQESVLDKIRAEVEQLPITDTAIKLVTEILDKYKTESEV